MSRIAVVGGGVGGLAVAARLAKMGHSVTLYEQASAVGGKLGWFEADGFRFDTGPSIVTFPEVFRNLWSFLGEPVTFDADAGLRRLDPIARYRFGDGTWFDAASDDIVFNRNIEQLRPGNADEMRHFLDRAGRIWHATRGPFLESPLRGFGTLLKLATTHARNLPTIAPWMTIRNLAKAELSDPRLVSFIDRYATYTGSDPRKAPAALAAIPYLERSQGGWYIDGGLRRIANLLFQKCLDLGVDFHLNTPVDEIAVDAKGRVSGVRTDRTTHTYDLVVANVDARHLYADLIPREPKARRALRSVRRATPSLSGFVMLLGVKGPTPELAHHTVLFPERYDDEFDDVFGTRSRPPRPVRDPTIYLSVPDDPTLAPPGHQSWFVLVNAPRHMPNERSAGVDWNEPGLSDRFGDRILQILADRGIDVRDRIVHRTVRTPANLERDTRSVGGSIYGTSSNGTRAAFLRPANRSPVPGLYLVGGSSHPGGGLPLVTLSAQIVAGLVGPS